MPGGLELTTKGPRMRLRCAVVLCLILMPASPARAAPEPAEAGFGKGFEIATPDGNYVLQIRGYVQPQLALLFGEEPGGDGLVAASFRVRRGRFYLTGNLFRPGLRYKLQLDFARERPLLDWYVEAHLTGSFWLRAGQYKMPFSRQFLASSSELALVERSRVTNAFTEDGAFGPLGVPIVDRDVGLTAGLALDPAKRVEVQLGVFNGNGPNQRQNDNTDFAWLLRLEASPLGKVDNEEGAFALRSEPRLGLGTSAVINPLTGGGVPWTVQGDAAFFTGPFAAQAEVFYADGGVSGADRLGFYLQVGWLLHPPSGLALAARYGRLDEDVDAAGVLHELALGPNFYVHEHRLKVQTNYVLELPSGGGPADHALVVQTTLAFK